jgi:hypothetical protein
MKEQESVKQNRTELIALVNKLLNIEGTFDDEQEQWKALDANFSNWQSVLSDIYAVIGGLNEMTAEEIVDKGLAYKPIELPEKMPRRGA